MSFSATTAAWNTGGARYCGRSPRRSLEIGGIILGFIFAWPLALAYLVWKVMGYPMPDDVRAFLQRNFGWTFEAPRRQDFRVHPTGNSAFEEYRRSELARLEEERRRLDEESRAFSDFVEELKRAKDREEFDAFMARRRPAGGAATA